MAAAGAGLVTTTSSAAAKTNPDQSLESFQSTVCVSGWEGWGGGGGLQVLSTLTLPSKLVISPSEGSWVSAICFQILSDLLSVGLALRVTSDCSPSGWPSKRPTSTINLAPSDAARKTTTH